MLCQILSHHRLCYQYNTFTTHLSSDLVPKEMKALYKNETWDTINFLTDKHTKNILREKGTQRTTQSIQGVYKRHLKARTKRRGDTKRTQPIKKVD